MHVEAVTDLTTEAFLAALKRFISRRGKPITIYSDNGSNFVGASNELRGLYEALKSSENNILDFCTHEGVEWKFIPSYSPHFGGLWEAGVKSLKFHLKRVVGQAHLTLEEFATVLVQVEAILNSRPLTPISSSPVDLEPLTPSHFLIGRSLLSVPEPDFTNTNENRLSRFQRVQQLRQQFWRRWSVEYIAELQTRCRWKQTASQLEPGALVLIKDKNLPPLSWQLGRVTDLYPGTDGKVRVASIKTQRGIIKRALATICPLPVQKTL